MLSNIGNAARLHSVTFQSGVIFKKYYCLNHSKTSVLNCRKTGLRNKMRHLENYHMFLFGYFHYSVIPAVIVNKRFMGGVVNMAMVILLMVVN
jgi:hypothetical protein